MHAADQQLADADVGDDPVENERDARRNQHRERSRDRDDAARELRVVAGLEHRRHRRRRQRRRRRRARTGDRAEAGAGERGRHAEAARNASDPGRGGLEQVVGDAAQDHELGHQDEHRDRDQLVRAGGRERRRRDDPGEDLQAADQVQADAARDDERERDRHAAREQREQQQRDAGRHHGGSSSAPEIGGSGCSSRSETSVAM